VIVDDLSYGKEANINSEAKLYKLDILDPAIEAVFQKEKPDYVNHHAAQIDVRRSVADPALDAKINILGTLNVLQNCIKYKVGKVIFASSGGALYGDQHIFPAPETHPLRPVSPYGITKLTAEHYLLYYKTLFGLDYSILRYSNVYGPRQDPSGEGGVVAVFIRKLLNGEQPVINGDGEQTRDFVYVEDVAEANIKALKCGSSNSIYNIGTGIETTIRQLFQLLKEITDTSIKEKYGPPKKGELLRSSIDYAKASKDLEWKPQTTLKDGLKETCEHFLS
jgi:UDP-glucose 4-epimerase